MSRPLIYGLIAATGFALAATTPSQAKLVCTRGSMVTNACVSALEKQLADAQRVVDCIKAMEGEYLGANGPAGAGAKFDAKKKQCLRLIAGTQSGVSVDSATADVPADENVTEVYNAILEWAQK